MAQLILWEVLSSYTQLEEEQGRLDASIFLCHSQRIAGMDGCMRDCMTSFHTFFFFFCPGLLPTDL